MWTPNEGEARVLRRLAKAITQIERAQTDFLGLPETGIMWGYLGLDNSIHCALEAKGIDLTKNHQQKLDKFFDTFPDAEAQWSRAQLREYCKHWNDVRYDRTEVDRGIGRAVISAAREVRDFCAAKIREAWELEAGALSDALLAVAEEQREVRAASLERAAEVIEHDLSSQEATLEVMGLSPWTAQMANWDRDILFHMSSDRQWVRDAIEGDQEVADRVVEIHRAFCDIVDRVIGARAEELLTDDPGLVNRPEELTALWDFRLLFDMRYSGLAWLEFSTSDDMRCMVEQAFEALRQGRGRKGKIRGAEVTQVRMRFRSSHTHGSSSEE